jgi:hypothetical protein
MVRSECGSPSEDNIHNVRGTKSNILGGRPKDHSRQRRKRNSSALVADVRIATILHKKDVLNHYVSDVRDRFLFSRGAH